MKVRNESLASKVEKKDLEIIRNVKSIILTITVVTAILLDLSLMNI
ncbi:hypothetical protein [Bacillus cereus group sp. MYBK242-2]